MPKMIAIKAKGGSTFQKALNTRKKGKFPVKAPQNTTFHKSLRASTRKRKNWKGGF